ncbi:MAG: Gx transporter family protein [Clostridiales bacterium]|nr:Gx transporter family protein [Clostridiales bacterium]MDY2833711.1 Gx transporter family protein [Candidatus Aphodomonas sp.]
MKKNVNKLTFMALLTTIMLILGYIESLFPIPGIPGIKLGLSNSVLMLALYWMGVPEACVLMVMKVLLSGLLFGGVSGMLYAFSGGVLSLAVMSVLIYCFCSFSVIGVGIAGAVCHNIGQVLAAMLVLQTNRLVYYMGVLVLIAIATGAATGTVAALLMKHIPPKVRESVKKKKN